MDSAVTDWLCELGFSRTSTRNTPTHHLTYAARVTRRMLHFNNLTSYDVPSLPIG
jgi:hypothetical protein